MIPQRNYIGMLLKKIIPVILVVFLVSGCIEQITFNINRSAGQLIVDGGITDNPGPYKLRLGLTSEKSTVPIPLSNALVTIVDGDGNREIYTETADGLYLLMGKTVKGERGQSYHIEIELPNGKKYQSFPETMPRRVGRDSVYIELGTVEEQSSSGSLSERNAVLVFADTYIPDHEDPVYLKWEVEGLYSFREIEIPSPFRPEPPVCYISQHLAPQNILLFSTLESDSELINKQLVATKKVILSEFYRRYYFNVIISSITERRYTYWEKVNEVINSTGTIFDVPPATVTGNIFNVGDEDEQVFGYFEAAIVDTARISTFRTDFPFFIPNPCGQFNPYRHRACRNCLSIENSSGERPYYY